MSAAHRMGRPKGQVRRLEVAPPDDVCISNGWDIDCPRPLCVEHVPPVDGDLRRRRFVCGRALVDVAAHLGGMTLHDIAFHFGVTHSAIHRVEKRAVAKLRDALRAIPP